jgi:hypothetical protein
MTDRLASPLVGDFNVAFVLQGREPPLGTYLSSEDPSLRDRWLSPILVPPHFPIVMQTPSLNVHANAERVRPRAHFAERVTWVADLPSATRALLADPELHMSVAESASPLSLPALARGRVRVDYPSDARATLDAEGPTGGLVVLHDTFADGWTATVDGRQTEIVPVNVLSRGVVVGPGRHRIEMSYLPPGLLPGLAISIVTLIALCVLAKCYASGHALPVARQP